MKLLSSEQTWHQNHNHNLRLLVARLSLWMPKLNTYWDTWAQSGTGADSSPNSYCLSFHSTVHHCYTSIVHVPSVLSLFYGRQSVDQFVLVSGSPLGPMTRFYAYPFFSDSCFVVLPVGRPLWLEDESVTKVQSLTVQSLRTNNHTLPSHLRLCSLFVASYDSQGLRWRYSNPPPDGVCPLWPL
jgi:hypothetical protein